MKLGNVRTIFFDLDNTLFDHSRAEEATLKLLMKGKPDVFSHIEPDEFVRVYDKYNTLLWKQMQQNEVSAAELKILRFKLTCDAFNLGSLNYQEMSEQYLRIYSGQVFIIPGMFDILNYLKPKYDLGVLSNGFARVQENKLSKMKITHYFKYRVYSQDVGAMKPSRIIFEKAMEMTKDAPEEIVYIGDSYENDIIGAKSVHWHTILFSPPQKATEFDQADFIIHELLELKEFF